MIDNSIAKNYEDLESRMARYIERKGSTAIFAGHYALERTGYANDLDLRAGTEVDDTFGAFPQVTFDLSARLINYGKSKGKESKILLCVDDHSQMIPRDWYARQDQDSLKIRQATERYFENFKIPKQFDEIVKKYNLSSNDFVISSYGVPYFQESKYREKFMNDNKGIDLGCAGEFELILEDIAKQGYGQLLAFIPTRCKNPTCDAANRLDIRRKKQVDIPEMRTIMAYMETGDQLNSAEDILDHMKGEWGGIPIIRRN